MDGSIVKASTFQYFTSAGAQTKPFITSNESSITVGAQYSAYIYDYFFNLGVYPYDDTTSSSLHKLSSVSGRIIEMVGPIQSANYVIMNISVYVGSSLIQSYTPVDTGEGGFVNVTIGGIPIRYNSAAFGDHEYSSSVYIRKEPLGSISGTGQIKISIRCDGMSGDKLFMIENF